jgi:hypothetical protein
MASTCRWLCAFALVISPAAVAAEDYVGVLRPPASPTGLRLPESGFYWPSASPFDAGTAATAAQDGFKLKLGYRYSKYVSVETGYADFGSVSLRSPFAAGSVPAWGKGYSLDTVGTLPLWTNASLYGRLGAWRSDGGSTPLAGAEMSPRAGAGLRYGLGFKYDVTHRLGLQAEMERFSPLDRWGQREADSDQLTVGVIWRF